MNFHDPATPLFAAIAVVLLVTVVLVALGWHFLVTGILALAASFAMVIHAVGGFGGSQEAFIMGVYIGTLLMIKVGPATVVAVGIGAFLNDRRLRARERGTRARVLDAHNKRRNKPE